MKNLEIIQNYLAGERPYIIVQGGVKAQPKEEHKVGDIWIDDNGMRFEKKNGYTIKSTRMGNLIKETIGEKICPDCKTDIKWSNQRLDEKFYAKTGRCMDCTIKFETDLRIRGLYKDYENKKVLLNQRADYASIRVQLEESVAYLKTEKALTFVNETGMVEEWPNVARKRTLMLIKKDLKEANRLIAEIDKMLANLKHVNI